MSGARLECQRPHMTLLYSVYQAMGRSNMTLVMACGGGGMSWGWLDGNYAGED